MPKLFLILHIIGVALGVGGATVVDVLVMEGRKNPKLNYFLTKFLPSLSRVIWAGLILLIVSGLYLFSQDVSEYRASGFFKAKMILLIILILNGIFLNKKITPSLQKLTPRPDENPSYEYKRLTRIATVSGVISIICWYGILIFGVLL